jgi:hypothetical protein
VKFGFARFGVAAGAAPPAPAAPPLPPLLSVVVVVLPVVSVDVDAVDDSVEAVLLLVESGVVVVIVVTTVVVPVVTVETIVVVACAPNGAAPAVNAAVVAPSAISAAKPAPQRAYLRLVLAMERPLPRRAAGYARRLGDRQTRLFNGSGTSATTRRARPGRRR